MKYQVTKAFKDVGEITRNIGDIIELDGARASKLLQYRLIGLIEQKPAEVIEEAVVDKSKVETAKKKRR